MIQDHLGVTIPAPHLLLQWDGGLIRDTSHVSANIRQWRFKVIEADSPSRRSPNTGSTPDANDDDMHRILTCREKGSCTNFQGAVVAACEPGCRAGMEKLMVSISISECGRKHRAKSDSSHLHHSHSGTPKGYPEGAVWINRIHVQRPRKS